MFQSAKCHSHTGPAAGSAGRSLHQEPQWRTPAELEHRRRERSIRRSQCRQYQRDPVSSSWQRGMRTTLRQIATPHLYVCSTCVSAMFTDEKSSPSIPHETASAVHAAKGRNTIARKTRARERETMAGEGRSVVDDEMECELVCTITPDGFHEYGARTLPLDKKRATRLRLCIMHACGLAARCRHIHVQGKQRAKSSGFSTSTTHAAATAEDASNGGFHAEGRRERGGHRAGEAALAHTNTRLDGEARSTKVQSLLRWSAPRE